MNTEQIKKELSIDEKLKFLIGGKTFETLGHDGHNIPAMSTIDGHNGVNLMQKVMDFIPIVLSNVNVTEINPAEIMGLFFEIGEKIGGITGMPKLFQNKVSEAEYAKMSEKAALLAKAFTKAVPTVLPNGQLPTAFPAGLSMASTWNKEMMFTCGQYVADETLAYKGDILLAPNINIHRDPHCGRMFESFSEDPYLTSQMVIPYIKGVQNKGVIANVKHFVANNQETQRHTINEMISERALREIYLPGFKAAVQDADCHTVMTAYNYVNGEACASNKYLLTDILRNEWGFDGLVLSDWNAVYDQVTALKAGNDLEMPGPKDQSKIINAIKNNELDEAVVEQSFDRFLDLVKKSPAYNNLKTDNFDARKHELFSREMASESIIMLKNNDTLPLEKNKQISVFGDNAFQPISCGTGSAGVVSSHVISGYDGLKTQFEEVTVNNENSEVAIIFIGEVCGEGEDRKSITLDTLEMDLVKKVSKAYKNKKVIGVFNVPGPIEMRGLDEYFDCILMAWYPGQEIGHAIADIVSGAVNPSGKLTCSMVSKVEDLATYPNFPGSFGTAVYGEDIFVGYRYYDIKKIEPSYCFGHGLSYSDFDYADLKINNQFKENGYVEVSVNIKNTSSLEGKEVIQLYVNDEQSKLKRPIRELKAFEKINFKPGEEKVVQFRLDKGAFNMYDPALKAWVVEPGYFNIEVGSSSRDIRQSERVLVDCNNPYPLTLKVALTDIMDREDVLDVIKKYIPEQLLSLPELQIEQIYHPDLTLDEAMDKHMFKHLNMTEKAFNGLKQKIEVEIGGM